MKAAAAALPPVTSLGAEWYKAPIDLNDWARSARRLWQFYRRRTRHKRREFDYRDREIGREIGGDGPAPSRRTIQRGHWFLEYVYKVIIRDHSGGHGRMVRILLPLAGDDAEEKPKAKAPARATPKPTPSPAPTATPKPTDSTPVDDRPLERGEARRIWEQERARAEAEPPRPSEPAAQPAGPDFHAERAGKAVRLVPNDLAALEFKESIGELKPSERERLDALRRNRSP